MSFLIENTGERGAVTCHPSKMTGSDAAKKPCSTETLPIPCMRPSGLFLQAQHCLKPNCIPQLTLASQGPGTRDQRPGRDFLREERALLLLTVLAPQPRAHVTISTEELMPSLTPKSLQTPFPKRPLGNPVCRGHCALPLPRWQ